MQPKNKKGAGLASAASLFSSYRSKAKKRGFQFELSFDQFLELAAGNCYLCGKPPSQKVKAQHRNGGFTYSGVDRVDSTVGYLIENCRSCCKTCNQMKSNLSLGELTDHLRKVFKRLSLWHKPDIAARLA